MSGRNWITVLIGAAITLIPQLLMVLPAPFQQLATAILAAIVAAWHLYEPSPNDVPPPPPPPQ